MILTNWSLALAIFPIFSLFGYSQPEQTIRWQENNPDSRRFTIGKQTYKEILLKNYNLKIIASMSFLSDYDTLSVELEIHNQNTIQRQLLPDKFMVEIDNNKDLDYISAKLLANQIKVKEYATADAIEVAGASATKTVTEHKTVTDTSPDLHCGIPNPHCTTPNPHCPDPNIPCTIPNPHCSIPNPHCPPKTKTEIVTKTEPDYSARGAAANEARMRREQADKFAQRIIVTSLVPVFLSSKSRIKGNVYFIFKTDTTQTTLRIPIDNLVIEIPFKVRKVGLFKRGRIFE